MKHIITVKEVVKKYGLEGFAKTYKDVYGRNIPFPDLETLPDRIVKDVYILIGAEICTITIC